MEAHGRRILRKKMKGLLLPQIELFNKMYRSVEEIPFERMEIAYHQIVAAVAKNKKGGVDAVDN